MSVKEITNYSCVAVEDEEEFSIPLDMSDIIHICQEYTKLTSQIQQQIEVISEIGVEESIKCGHISLESLPSIKRFLNAIRNNQYFGDAANQAKSCLFLINQYEENLNKKHLSSLN